MHNYARKRFEQFCFIFHKVIAKLTKFIFTDKILAALILLKILIYGVKPVSKTKMSKNVEKYLGLSVAKSTLYNI